MIFLWTAALAGTPPEPPPIELIVAPSYRSAQIDTAGSAGTSSAGEGHYGLQLGLRLRLRSWFVLEAHANQAIFNLWFETEPRMQRFGGLRALVGPRWHELVVRLRGGVTSEGIVGTRNVDQYFPVSMLEWGSEIGLEGPAARLVVGVSALTWPGQPPGRILDAKAVVPNHTRLGAVVGVQHRVYRGEYRHDGPLTTIHDRNLVVSVGLSWRPRSAPE